MLADIRTRSALVWGIPIDILDLTSNMEAYIKTKPVLTTLKLCARPKSVPTELVSMIEQYLLRSARSEAREKISKNHACGMAKCRPCNHVQPEELYYEVCKQEKNFEFLSFECCDIENGVICQDHEYFFDDLLDDEDVEESIREEHVERRKLWEDSISSRWRVETINKLDRELGRGKFDRVRRPSALFPLITLQTADKEQDLIGDFRTRSLHFDAKQLQRPSGFGY